MNDVSMASYSDDNDDDSRLMPRATTRLRVGDSLDFFSGTGTEPGIQMPRSSLNSPRYYYHVDHPISSRRAHH